MTIKELGLLALVIAILVFGIFAVTRSTKYTSAEKTYWIIIICVFNIIGVLVFFADHQFFKKGGH